MKTKSLLTIAAVFLLAVGIGLSSCGIVVPDAGTLQAGLISCGFGVGILLVLSLRKD